MIRARAIDALLQRTQNALVVTANGWISREACASHDRDTNFYMLGSMGLASPIGLGLALTNPSRRVVVLDGDGNLLMALGTLAMIAAEAPRNFVHVVLDNEVYGSTGGQPSLSSSIDLDAMARAAGYAHVQRVDDVGDIDLDVVGPAFFLVKCEPLADGTAPRVPLEPEQIAARFRSAL